MPLLPPSRPLKGQPIPDNWFQDFYDYVQTLRVSGDGSTTTVHRDHFGTIVRAPFATSENAASANGGGDFGDYCLVAKITADNGDGTYEAEAQKNNSGTFADRDSSTYTFDTTSVGSGYLYELNGKRGVDTGTFVFAKRVPDADGQDIWYFDSNQAGYGVYQGGAWVELTSDSSPYSWKQKEPDATTDTSPAVTGSSNLYEVSGRDGIKIGSKMWVRFDGTNFRCEYHGAPLGTAYDVLAGTSTTINTDTWDRANQDSGKFGVDHEFIARIAVDSTSGAVYAFCREKQYGANGHLNYITGETRKQIFTIDPTAILCTTEMQPDDSAVSGSLSQWLKADAISGLSDTDPVTTWTASSGTNATQTTSTNKPTYKTGIYNSLPTVRFTTDDYLDWSSVLDTLTSASTLFLVGTGSAGFFLSDFYETSAGAPNDDKDGTFVQYDGRIAQYERSGSPNTDSRQASMSGLTVLAAQLYNNGSTRMNLFSNGETSNTDIDGGAITATSSPVNSYIGAAPANGATPSISGYLEGDVCEIIIYSAVLTDEQIEQISCGLISKWGI